MFCQHRYVTRSTLTGVSSQRVGISVFCSWLQRCVCEAVQEQIGCAVVYLSFVVHLLGHLAKVAEGQKTKILHRVFSLGGKIFTFVHCGV